MNTAFTVLGTICAIFLGVQVSNYVKAKLIWEYGHAMGMFRLNLWIALLLIVASCPLTYTSCGFLILACMNLVSARYFYSERNNPKFQGLPAQMCHPTKPTPTTKEAPMGNYLLQWKLNGIWKQKEVQGIDMYSCLNQSKKDLTKEFGDKWSSVWIRSPYKDSYP
jgi:hypothetical protein